MSNALPDLPSTDTQPMVDVPVPVLPPEVCVGLLPSEDKWLPEMGENASEDGGRAETDEADAGVIGESIGGDTFTAMDGMSSADVVGDADVALDIPNGPTPSPRFPIPNAPDTYDKTSDLDRIADSREAGIDPCEVAPATCSGAVMPEWELYDFQPRSCGYKATYGLDVFKSRVTVVALLAAW